jgi:hypothetical protein
MAMDSGLSAIERLSVRPVRLLTQNSNLRRDGIFNWCLPAWAGRLPDGRTYNACPSAGICVKVCYARAGSYRFSNVLERHQRNLAYVLDDLPGFTAQMIAEIGRKRGPVVVRIHDAGDFFSDPYTIAWREVMAAHPAVRFYAYTKEIDRFRRLIEPDPPANFKWVFSYGGTQDALLDEVGDRVCDVFPNVDALAAAGYHDQAASDLLAVDGPAPVGMAANNIPHFKKRQGDRTFRTWQVDADGPRRTVLDLTAVFDAAIT